MSTQAPVPPTATSLTQAGRGGKRPAMTSEMPFTSILERLGDQTLWPKALPLL